MSRSRHSRRLCVAAALAVGGLFAAAATAEQPSAPQPAASQQPSPSAVQYAPAYYPPPVQPSDDVEIEYFGASVPPGHHVETRHRKGFLIGGGVTLGVSYVAGIWSASTPADRNWMFVPVVGPWVAFGTHGDKCGAANYDAGFCHDASPTLYFMDALAQTAGAIFLAVGLASTRQVLVRDSVPGSGATAAPRITVGPAWFGPRLPGISLNLVLDPDGTSR
jgi:hypothetical protein